METIPLAYGPNPLMIARPDNLVQILEPQEIPPVANAGEELKRALSEPIGSPSLRELARGKPSVAILISDKARIFPRREMIEAVLSELGGIPDERITMVVARGRHPPSEIKALGLGKKLLNRFKLIQHEAEDPKEMVYIGKTSRGTQLLINKVVAEAELKITIGQIKPHYFAGFGGGAKSILPGVAALETIATNHFLKTDPRARLGVIKENPVRIDMEEAARLGERIFCFNVVTNRKGELLKAVAGDIVSAHRKGVEYCRRLSQVKAEKADIVIASQGRPGSINIYQMTKAVAPAQKIVNEGGVIICAGDCSEGVGGAVIINKIIFELGLSRNLPREVDILLVSELSDEEVGTTFFRPVASVREGLDYAYRKIGKGASVSVIPDTGLLIPVVEGDHPEDWV